MEGLSSAVITAVNTVLSFLPDSPFVALQNLSQSEFYEWLCYLNWFIPVNTFVAILEGWLVCIAVYYVYQVVLRWIKAIE